MSPTYLFIVFIAVCTLHTVCVVGDLYLQNPRGNNNRLNENSADRQNDKRLFDSENNARGGYCWGPELSYYEGSVLSIEWTNQHACGNDNTKCNIIIQYMCSDDSEGADETLMIRDGTTTATIPPNGNPGAGEGYYNYKDPNVGSGTSFRYGMNEPFSVYQDCAARSRNKGLFTGVENLNNNAGAFATRQNAGGTVHGFECSEERDYYPYWHPSAWKDVAVLVDNKGDCGYYQKNSQNVLYKNYCNGTAAARATNNERDCQTASGTWVRVEPWGNGKPACVEAPFNRDNHLGNGVDGFANSFNWTLPRTKDEDCIANGRCACVIRVRYNISIGDIPADLDSRQSGQVNSPVKDDPTVSVSGYNFTLALDTAQTGRTFQDRSFMFRLLPRPSGVSKNAKIYNLNVRGKRGNIVQTFPATEYDFVPTFLRVEKDDFVHFQWTGCDTNPDNQGEGRARTDRSNIVQIADMSRNYPMTDAEIAASDNVLFKDDELRARMAQIDQENCLNYTALLEKNGGNAANVEQDVQNCMKLNAAPTGRFSGPLVKMTDTGTYYYMSTRNNNFSNRSQKASITVKSSWPAWKTAVIVVAGVVALAGGAIGGTIFYAKRNPHSRVAEFVHKVPGLSRV